MFFLWNRSLKWALKMLHYSAKENKYFSTQKKSCFSFILCVCVFVNCWPILKRFLKCIQICILHNKSWSFVNQHIAYDKIIYYFFFFSSFIRSMNIQYCEVNIKALYGDILASSMYSRNVMLCFIYESCVAAHTL